MFWLSKLGGLAEKPVPGGVLGPTFACLMGQQFLNIKRGKNLLHFLRSIKSLIAAREEGKKLVKQKHIWLEQYLWSLLATCTLLKMTSLAHRFNSARSADQDK